jgi:hypothetical protein
MEQLRISTDGRANYRLRIWLFVSGVKSGERRTVGSDFAGYDGGEFSGVH